MRRLALAFAALAGAFALAGLVSGGSAARGALPEADPALEVRVLTETIDELETRLDRDPRNPVVGSRLVGDHLAAFRLTNDLVHLRRAEEIAAAQAPLAIDPAPAYARLSAARLARHDFTGAFAAARRAAAADSTDPAALGALYDAAVATGAYGRAEDALRTLLARRPDDLGTKLRHARWLAATGDAAGAYDRLSPACERLRGRAVRRQVVAWCEVVLAGFADGAGRPSAARALLEDALETQPGYPAALEGLAEAAYGEERWEDARELFLRIETDAHPDLQLRLAEVERALDMHRRAAEREAAFLRLTADPEARALQARELAIFLAGPGGEPDRALRLARADVERRPSVEAYETLAWVLWRRGELERALDASDASRRWGTPSATNDYLRARILEGLGRLEEARTLDARRPADGGGLDPHAYWHERRARARG